MDLVCSSRLSEKCELRLSHAPAHSLGRKTAPAPVPPEYLSTVRSKRCMRTTQVRGPVFVTETWSQILKKRRSRALPSLWVFRLVTQLASPSVNGSCLVHLRLRGSFPNLVSKQSDAERRQCEKWESSRWLLLSLLREGLHIPDRSGNAPVRRP